MANAAMLQAVLVAAVLGCAVAFPTFFPDRVLENAACDAHPMEGFGAHAAPTADTDLTFMVEDADGNAVTDFCPGKTYGVTVEFSSTFKCKLTVTLGELSGAEEDCPNLRNFLVDDSGSTASSYSTEWTVPCGADGDMAEFKVTGATSRVGGYKTNTLSLPLKEMCSGC